MGWVVRHERRAGTVSRSKIQDIIRETTGVPVTNITNMDDIVSIDTSRQRLNMLLMTIFGGSALVLAAIGIYGLMAYSVQHRTQEIGIRMALGAQADRVRWSIVGQGMTLVGVGIVVGIVAAFFLATFLAAALYGVQAARRHGASSACRPCSPRRRSRPSGSRRGARAASIRSRRCATNERAAAASHEHYARNEPMETLHE